VSSFLTAHQQPAQQRNSLPPVSDIIVFVTENNVNIIDILTWNLSSLSSKKMHSGNGMTTDYRERRHQLLLAFCC